MFKPPLFDLCRLLTRLGGILSLLTYYVNMFFVFQLFVILKRIEICGVLWFSCIWIKAMLYKDIPGVLILEIHHLISIVIRIGPL